MAYTPYVWKDDPTGGTPITATRLNAIETALSLSSAVADSASAAVAANASAITTANANIASNASGIVTANTTIAKLALRAAERSFNVMDYGAKGDGSTDDTAAVQAAVTAALSASDPINVEIPLYNGKSPIVFFPLGTYSVNTINIPGALVLRGVEGGIYAASVIRQRTAGQHILSFTADTDGISNCSVVEDLTFKSGSGTSDPNVAQICVDASSANSMYFRKCWFKTPERFAIWQKRCGDIKIESCTFDVIPFTAIKMGSTLGSTGDISITGCTFYEVSLNCVELYDAANVGFVNNRIGNAILRSSSVVVSIGSGIAGTNTGSISIVGNTVDTTQYFVLATATTSQAPGRITVTGNTITNVGGSIFEVSGSGIIYQVSFQGNTATAKNTSFASGGAFVCVNGGVQAGIFSHNSIMCGNTAYLFYAPSGLFQNNYTDRNPTFGFANHNNFTNTSNHPG